MGDISTGPVSSLPHSLHYLTPGATCDQHPDRPAKARVQGETDSFGCEYNDLCEECLADEGAYRQEARKGTCEWCKVDATDLRDTRDYEEGFYGRVYRVCGACIERRDDRLSEELDGYGYGYDYDYDED